MKKTGIIPVNLKTITSKAANIYEAIVVTSKEARKINEENKTEFNALMNTFAPSSEDDFDDRDNTEQEKISVEFEKREKPHRQALNALLNEEIKFRYKSTEI